VRRDSVAEVIKSMELRDAKLFKLRYGDFTLHDFVHSFLFMECLDAGEVIGVAADYGVIVQASGGKVSYKRKLYLELILVKYVLEMKERYPWFKEAELSVDSPFRVIGRTFIDSGLALEDPSLEYLFQAYLKTVMRILELEDRKLEMVVLRTFSRLRRWPVLKQIYWLKFAFLKLALNMPFDNRKDDNPVLERSEAYALSSLDELLG
jgi:hypothetical protein